MGGLNKLKNVGKKIAIGASLIGCLASSSCLHAGTIKTPEEEGSATVSIKSSRENYETLSRNISGISETNERKKEHANKDAESERAQQPLNLDGLNGNFPPLLKEKAMLNENNYSESLEEKIKMFDDYIKCSFDAKKWFIEIPAYSLAAFAGTVLWHELGHARTAFYLGAEDIKIHGPNLKIGLISGVSFIPPKDMSKHEDNLIAIAGVNSTTAMGEFLYQSLTSGKIPDTIKPFVATTALFMMADRHRYLWSEAIKNFLRMKINPWGDFNSIMLNLFEKPSVVKGFYIEDDGFRAGNQVLGKGFYTRDNNGKYNPLYVYVDEEGLWKEQLDPYRYVHIKKGPCKLDNHRDCYEYHQPKRDPRVQKKLDIAYGIAAGMSVLELGLRFDQIKYLVGTALGNNPKAPEGFDVIKAGFYPIKDGFLISINGQW